MDLRMGSPYASGAKKVWVLAECPETVVHHSPASTNPTQGYLTGLASQPGYIGDPTAMMENSNVLSAKNNDFEFELSLDFSQNPASNLQVRVVDNWLIISASSSRKQCEHGFASNEYMRRYLLPRDVDLTNVRATLNAERVLTITATKRWIDFVVPIVVEADPEDFSSVDDDLAWEENGNPWP